MVSLMLLSCVIVVFLLFVSWLSGRLFGCEVSWMFVYLIWNGWILLGGLWMCWSCFLVFWLMV